MVQDWAFNYCNICGINFGLERYYGNEDMCGITDKNTLQYNPDKLLYNVMRVVYVCSVGLKDGDICDKQLGQGMVRHWEPICMI